MPGMWAAQAGKGAQQVRILQAVWMNVVLLLVWSGVKAVALAVGIGAIAGLLFYQLFFALARSRYRKLSGIMGATPNSSVIVPDPAADLKGHPRHLYYTIPFDATTQDVKICGWLCGNFTYTSVTCYGWDSLPPPQFLFDETIVSDGEASRGLLKGAWGSIDVSPAFL